MTTKAEDLKKKQEEAMKILETLESLKDRSEIEDMVKNNVIEFDLEGAQYRVRPLNRREQTELYERRAKKFKELFSSDYDFEEIVVKKYKEKGIDIPSYNTRMQGLQSRIEDVLLNLATIAEEKTIDRLKNEIIELRTKQSQLLTEKSGYLTYTIENQLLSFSIAYAVYLVLETKKEEKWSKLFKDYEEFEASENMELLNTAIGYISYLMNLNEFSGATI